MKVPPAILLHIPFYGPDEKAPDRCAETKEWLLANTERLAAAGIEVLTIPVRGDFDNYNAFQRVWWEPKTLLHLDHDCVPTFDMVLKLSRCAYGACTQVYRWAQPYGEGHSAIFDRPVFEDDGASGISYLSVDSSRGPVVPEWCDRTGFGLIKLDFQTRIRHPLPAGTPSWVGFDSLYCGNMKMREPLAKWHVHRADGEDPFMRHNH